MPPLEIDQTLLAACEGQWMGQRWVNVLGIRLAAPTVLTQAIADHIGADCRTMYNSLSASLSNDWSLTGIVIYDLQDGTAPSWDVTMSAITGTNNGANLSPATAACVSHKTALRGRRYRGRTYLAGFTENDNDDQGRFLAATATAVGAAFNALSTLLEAYGTAPATLAVVSRVGLVSTPITNSTCDLEWDHQDRRKRA